MASNNKNSKVSDNFVELPIKLPKLQNTVNPDSLRFVTVQQLKLLHKAIYQPDTNKDIIDAVAVIEAVITNHKFIPVVNND